MGAPGASSTPPTGLGWVDAAVRVVTQVGFPVVAAGVLLYFVLFRFTDQVAAVAQRLEANASAVERVTALHAQEIEELKRQTVELARQTSALQEIVAYTRWRSQAQNDADGAKK